MRRCVWSRNLMSEEAIARVGPQRHRIKKYDLLTYPMEYSPWEANKIIHDAEPNVRIISVA